MRGVLVVLIDIDDDHRLRKALDDQRKQLQLVIDNIGVPMSYIDRDWCFRFANQPGLDWKVANPVEAIGKRVDEMFDAQAMKVIGPQIEACLKGEKHMTQQGKMTACNKEASAKAMKGDDRKAFMSKCLSG